MLLHFIFHNACPCSKFNISVKISTTSTCHQSVMHFVSTTGGKKNINHHQSQGQYKHAFSLPQNILEEKGTHDLFPILSKPSQDGGSPRFCQSNHRPLASCKLSCKLHPNCSHFSPTSNNQSCNDSINDPSTVPTRRCQS